ISFILLRRRMPNIERPYRSPLGIPGAALTVSIAIVTLYFQLQHEAYRVGVYASLAWYVTGILYFAFIGRHGLVLSPEAEFALTRGGHGHPQRDGYGTTKVSLGPLRAVFRKRPSTRSLRIQSRAPIVRTM